MAFFSPSTRPLAWAGFVLIGFSCVWFVVLLVFGIGPEEEERADATQMAASVPPGASAETQSARPSPVATTPLTPSTAVSNALQSTQNLDERASTSSPGAQSAPSAPAAPAQITSLPTTQTTAVPAPENIAAVPPNSVLASPAAATYPSTPPPRPAQAESGPSPRALTQGLAVRGHTVHASVSGHSSSTTLSVSGRTLTRSDCIEWLADPKTRGGLRAAGVHVVVATNGAQSWTFML